MILSRTTRKDPTHTKTLRESYRRDLVRLFRSYRRDALLALDQSRDTTSRLLAAADIDLIRLDEVLRASGAELVTKGMPITRDHVLQNYTAGTGFGTKQLNRIGVEAVIGTGPADWRVMDALKVRNLSALRGVTEEMNKQIIRELSDGINLGESMPKLAKRITGRVDSIGIVRATAIARTETLHAFNQGAELRYAQAGIQTLEWLSAHDPPRVCEQCLALDKTTFRVKDSHPRPPIHVNCRCTVIPVLGKPPLKGKGDTVKGITDNINETRESATLARREFNTVRKWNAKWRDDIRMGMRVAPKDMIRAWTGKTPSFDELAQWRRTFGAAERAKEHFITKGELALLGKWGKKMGFSDKAIKEIALSGRLNKYDIELDDLLMELRAIKGGRHLGIDAAIKKYEKRIYDRPGEELYIVDKNGQRIFYNSSTEAGLSGFADIRGAASNGIMLMNQADGKVVMIEDYLRYAASSNLAEVRMVAGDKVYIIRRTGKWDQAYYEDVVSPTMHKVKRDLNAALIAADKESRVGTGWYDLQVWKRTAAQCDEIEYDEAIPSSLIKAKPKTAHEIAEERAIRQRREEERLKDILRKIAGG